MSDPNLTTLAAVSNAPAAADGGAPQGRSGYVTLLLTACGVLAACVTLRASDAIAEYNFLNFVSGAWVSLARDLSEGIFYRPLVDADGFGGTRFFPLQFICHAALIRAGLDPFAAGFVLTITWTLLLLAGVFVFLRRSGAPVALAVAGGLLPLGSMAVFTGLVDIRGDVLPAALNIWGLAMCVTTKRDANDDDDRPPPVGWAAVFFTLAFSAKITTVFGVTAGFLALLLNGRRRSAMRLAAMTTAGWIVVVTLVYIASGGRIVEIFRACAAGGTDITYFAQSPLRLVTHYVDGDPIGLFVTMMALGGVLGMLAVVWRDVTAIAVLTTLAITLLIFGSPGTSFNHVIDLTVIAFIFVIVQAVRQRVAASFVVGVMTIIAGVAAMQNLQQWRDSSGASRKSEMRTTVAATAAGDASTGPILAEDPMIPIVSGRRPYVLDSWMLRLIAEKDPSVMSRLSDELRARKFRAVVLLNDPTRDGGKYLEERVFGQGFVAPLLENYEHAEEVGRFKVYKPKPAAPKP